MTSHVLRRLPQPVRVLLAVTSSSTTSCLATQRVPELGLRRAGRSVSCEHLMSQV